jgi:hypothetical protein
MHHSPTEFFMRHKIQLVVLGLAVAAAAACSTPEKVIPTEAIPSGGVRFINAVPDTSGALGLDFGFIDIVESNRQFRMTFRNGISTAAPFVSTLTQYKSAREGSRRFRIFPDDTIQTIASLILKDSSMSISATKNYTVMLWGNARSTGADRMKLTIWEEAVPDPGASVALRVVNTTSAPIDVRVYAQGGTAPVAATWAAVPAYSASSYITQAPGNYMYNVQPAGGGANLFADAQAVPGSATTVDVQGNPGTTQAGSAVTGFVYPRSAVGARTPQTAAFAVPAIGFNWDRRPPLTCAPLC